MSSATTASGLSFHELGRHYGKRARDPADETWLEDAVEDYLGITVTAAQRRICRAIVNNEKVLVQTANGLGKSYILAGITNVWLVCYHPATALATSGTYPKLKRTFCKPVEDLHDSALGGLALPGTYKQNPPRIEIDDEPMQYFEAASPKDAGELEGVHEGHTLGVIEEADKDDVDAETLDSMDSLVTDQRDRIVAIANPPRDESNSITPLYDDPTWEVIRLSSFESHNVQVELGESEGEMIDGLATLWKIKQDWESFNDEPWPGVEAARTAHERRSDLDERWYRRRAGVVPKSDTTKHRPFHTHLVRTAVDTTPQDTPPGPPEAIGIDLARKGGDETVVCLLYQTQARFHAWSHTDHPENERRCREIIDSLHSTPEIAVDAQGEGSGVADTLRDAYGATRFKNSENAVADEDWDNKWTESLNHLGNWLDDLALGAVGSDHSTRLREDLFAAARHVEYEERGLKSGDVLRATPKSEIKAHLERSPDRLDALAMAAWAADVDPTTASGTGVW